MDPNPACLILARIRNGPGPGPGPMQVGPSVAIPCLPGGMGEGPAQEKKR